MSSHDWRRDSRRSSMSRRLKDRRYIPYPFGSAEWIDNIKKAYLAWPKFDRRDENRRANERRELDRRSRQDSEQTRSEQKYSPILLTQEERKMIECLYLNEAV